MASSSCSDGLSAFGLLFQAASIVPAAHFLATALLFLVIFLYNFLEIHVLGDLFRGFRGDPVVLTFNPSSKIYEGVVSKCRILHGRYLASPWLSSPHLQTVFLNFFGRPPSVVYRSFSNFLLYSRKLFSVHDGETVALDWLLTSDVIGGPSFTDIPISKDDRTPIAVVVPGLTSDSFSPYLRHCAYSIAKHGWHVVVSNHRGLGGISITSDCFYNAGWTEDLREVINYLHQEYPKAPIFAVGTSIGANILVKYLGEEGENTPLAGATSICSPWDLVVGDRFISRKLVQRLYDKALAIGLKGYAQLHQSTLIRLANWEGIRKSTSVRDFDNHATCHVGRFETVDTYYRCCSSVNFIGKVAVPLLCINALDDPVCTREAIPWDECRANKNVVLATTTHGGHLAYFKGLTAKSLWWVGAVVEYLDVLHSSPFMHRQEKTQNFGMHHSLESDIDKAPYVNIVEDGIVAPIITEGTGTELVTKDDLHVDRLSSDSKPEDDGVLSVKKSDPTVNMISPEPVEPAHREEAEDITKTIHDMTAPVKRSLNQLLRCYDISRWLLAYIAIVTTWPLLGSALSFVFRKKLRGFLPVGWLRR
ncbi:embryogenesis-associated protein EMB8-like isoform X1 [Zingiber officinale]|uniref:embryogenesis-associated protein EMB8-like isoform X1 n=1 Tax=Zingiber officinale TaxID=94328 RepID=UPI001C4C8DF4|nr:embryogenesis-associated protein EMB8-like isoform X1 [Zingiber officinale]